MKTRITLMTLAVLALLATAALRPTHAAKPASCGPVVYGHTIPGSAPTHVCGPNNDPAFAPGDHYQTTDTPCPFDQTDPPYPNYAGVLLSN